MNNQLGVGFVYLFSKSNLYKIGITGNVEKRRRELASVYRADVQLVSQIQVRHPRALEVDWMDRFDYCRVTERPNGIHYGGVEWFQLSSEDVEWVCTQDGSRGIGVEYVMSLDESIAYLQENNARIRFFTSHGDNRVHVKLPEWREYFYIERGSVTEAAAATRERQSRAKQSTS